MTPILFADNATSFTTWGIGILSDALSCVVTEERNGKFELEMTYPIGGTLLDEIQQSRIILATPSDGKSPQPFRIYRITRPMGGVIGVYAEHVSYQLSHIPVAPFSARSVTETFQLMAMSVMTTCPFTFWTDKTDNGRVDVDVPVSIRSLMGDGEDCILDVYGGEWEYDGYTCKLWDSRGTDNGVEITYGKNLTDLEQEESIALTVTGIAPYWHKEGYTLILPEKILLSDNADNFPYYRILPVDFSSEFQDEPLEGELRAAGEQYLADNDIGVPDVSLKISFAPLWQSEEYKDLAVVERVQLCDYVTVRFPALGVTSKNQVTAIKFDVLAERYTEITIGESDLLAFMYNPGAINPVKKEVTK